MCCTLESLKKHFGNATARSVKLWRPFIMCFLALLVLYPVKFSLFMAYVN